MSRRFAFLVLQIWQEKQYIYKLKEQNKNDLVLLELSNFICWIF